jgi:hypothetical protein
LLALGHRRLDRRQNSNRIGSVAASWALWVTMMRMPWRCATTKARVLRGFVVAFPTLAEADSPGTPPAIRRSLCIGRESYRGFRLRCGCNPPIAHKIDLDRVGWFQVCVSTGQRTGRARPADEADAIEG